MEPEKYKIVDISFAFDNREMLILLEKRNKYLSKADFAGAKKVEHQLNALKDKNMEKYIVPNTCYCTFMHGEGAQIALN